LEPKKEVAKELIEDTKETPLLTPRDNIQVDDESSEYEDHFHPNDPRLKK